MNNTSGKYYIFLIPTIKHMGGAQMYVNAKFKSLKDDGWNVFVFHGIPGESILPLMRDNAIHVPELEFAANVYGRKQRERVINNIVSYLSLKEDSNNIIIETTCVSPSTWGECLAREIGAKHLIFILNEKNQISSELYPFYRFKHERGELAGIRKEIIYDMFKDHTDELHLEDMGVLSAFGCTHVVEDIPSKYLQEIESLQSDYVIGSIGRLDKPFVGKMLDGIISFCKDNPNKMFTILFIGGHPIKAEEERIKEQIESHPNCNIIITGYMFPLPRKLIQLMDVCIASAGSAIVSHKLGVHTITVDANDFLPIGIKGITCESNLLRSPNEPVVSYESLLHYLLIDKKYKPHFAQDFVKPDYSSHFEFVNRSDKSKKYFDIEMIKVKGLSLKIMKFMINLAGPGFYHKLSEIKRIKKVR